MQSLHEIFDPSMPRLGPGEDASTVKALDVARATPFLKKALLRKGGARVLDLGCGNGAQTIQLAKRIDGTILAVDVYQPYLDEMFRRAEAEGVAGKITPCLSDMAALEAEEGAFDLVWSEGALFCMGFRKALAACHRWLAPGGVMAVTELCWFNPEPPAECRQFFTEMCPEMMDVSGTLSAFLENGYKHLDHFLLPESAWRDKYIAPLEKRLSLLRQNATGTAEKLGMLDLIQKEIDIYRRYHEHYGYAFYVMQR